MNRDQIVQFKKDAENRCREVFDQLTTFQQQVNQLEVELERTRGDFRTYDNLLKQWPADDIPEEDRHLPPPPVPAFPENDKSSKKEKANG